MKNRMLGLCAFFFAANLHCQEVESLSLDNTERMDGIYKDGDTLYIAEGWDGNRVFKVLPSGEVTTIAEGLAGPVDVVKRENGNLYVSEWNAAQVSVIYPSGDVELYASVATGPGPMTMDESETIYVTHNANDGSGVIMTIDIAGSVSVLAEGDPLINPGGIDFGTDGNLYVANFNDGNIILIRPDTTMMVIGTVPADGFWKTGHLTAGVDQLFVSGISSNIIYAVDFAGLVTEFAGTGESGHVDGPLETSQFASPNGIFFDDNGILYITRAFGAADYIQFIDVGFAGISEGENSINPLSIYPNPSNGRITLDLGNLDDVSVQIYSASGELITNYKTISTPMFEIDLTERTGLFLVKVIASEGVYSSRIIVK